MNPDSFQGSIAFYSINIYSIASIADGIAYESLMPNLVLVSFSLFLLFFFLCVYFCLYWEKLQD